MLGFKAFLSCFVHVLLVVPIVFGARPKRVNARRHYHFLRNDGGYRGKEGVESNEKEPLLAASSR